MYLITGTRPYHIFEISFLKQCPSPPHNQYMASVKPCLEYINRMQELILLFHYSTAIVITGYSKSDYANSINRI
jgi:hypothetical protein